MARDELRKDALRDDEDGPVVHLFSRRKRRSDVDRDGPAVGHLQQLARVDDRVVAELENGACDRRDMTAALREDEERVQSRREQDAVSGPERTC